MAQTNLAVTARALAVPPAVSAPPVSKFSHVRYQLAGARPALWLRAPGE
ncbi:hypothetical protein NKJ73_19895 [Mesorhizobium sp. M0074]